MKKAIFSALFIIIAGHGFAQSRAGVYYEPISWPSNGFLTVEQENKLMTEKEAELQRQKKLEERTPEQIAKDKKKEEDEATARRRRFEAMITPAPAPAPAKPKK